MNKVAVLVKREFWEHRSAFVMLPLIITGFFLLMLLIMFTASTTDTVSVTIDLDNDHSELRDEISSDDAFDIVLEHLGATDIEERVRFMHGGLSSMSAPLLLVLWFVMFFYLLNCLYQDRRDRSILFWKSMPVSDTFTVLSKLGVALFVVPLVYLLGVAVLQFVGLILLSLAAIGSDIAIWETIWAPSNLLSEWFSYIGIMLFYSLWALPFYGWLLVVSAYVKSVPLAWALGVPMGVSIMERMFTDQSRLARWMGEHTVPISFVDESEPAIWVIRDHFFSLNMVSAIVVGAALIALAIWLRGRADEI